MYDGPMTFSRINDGEQCGLLFNLRHVEKRKEPDSPHFEKGNRVHEAIEHYLKKRMGVIPDEAEKMRGPIAALRGNKTLIGEQAWGYDGQWNPLPVTGYFSKQDVVRAKVDALIWPKADSITLIDFKTGKVRPAGIDQLRFYAMLALLRYQKAKRAALELWFLEHGEVIPGEEIARGQLAVLKKEFDRRIAAVRLKKPKPEPGIHCRWCPFSRDKGGPCQY